MPCDPQCQDELWSNAIELSGFFTLIVWAISLYQIYKHLRHFTNNQFQTRIITIIFMAPFYALTSFLTISYQDYKGFFGLFRDIYESILIYAFFYLLSMYIAYDPDTKEIDYQKIYQALGTKGIRPHIFPMNYVMEPMILISETRGEWFYRKAKIWILQYLAIKPIVTFFLIIIYIVSGVESYWNLFFKSLVFISVGYSVYYLVLFYQLLKEELAFAKPLLKFIAVKGVLFFTTWQDIVIEIFSAQILSYFTFNPDEDEAYQHFIIGVCTNLLVCFEMIILAVLLVKAFSHREFKEMQKRGYFFGQDQARVLTKRLLNDVITTNFVHAMGEIQELKGPLKDPFKHYDGKRAKLETHDMMTVSAKIDQGILGKEVLDEFKVNINEKPLVIPDFIDSRYSTMSHDHDHDDNIY